MDDLITMQQVPNFWAYAAFPSKISQSVLEKNINDFIQIVNLDTEAKDYSQGIGELYKEIEPWNEIDIEIQKVRNRQEVGKAQVYRIGEYFLFSGTPSYSGSPAVPHQLLEFLKKRFNDNYIPSEKYATSEDIDQGTIDELLKHFKMDAPENLIEKEKSNIYHGEFEGKYGLLMQIDYNFADKMDATGLTLSIVPLGESGKPRLAVLHDINHNEGKSSIFDPMEYQKSFQRIKKELRNYFDLIAL